MKHHPAIDPDEHMDRQLGEINAAEFIQLLAHRDLVALAPLVADKKKYELWVEENLGGIRLGELIVKIRGEKKKLELEKMIIERWVDPRFITKDGILTRMASKVEADLEQ